MTSCEGRSAMSDYDAQAGPGGRALPSATAGARPTIGANGLLLRADLHDLFDLGLVAVDTGTMKLALAKDLVGTTYEPLAGHRLRLPSDRELRPSVEALDKHRERSLVA